MCMPDSYPLDRTEYGKHNILITSNHMCMAQPTTIEERQARKDLKRAFRLLSTRFETCNITQKRTMSDVLLADCKSFEPPKL